MAERKITSFRVSPETLEAFKVVADFRGESVNDALISAMKLLTETTFREEIREGKNILLRKLPKPFYLSDLCEAFEIPFQKEVKKL
jgi:hypothetical protein